MISQEDSNFRKIASLSPWIPWNQENILDLTQKTAQLDKKTQHNPKKEGKMTKKIWAYF